MGGGGQANSGQASTAAAQQTAASNQDMAISAQNAARQKQLTDQLFGNGSSGSTGTLSGYLDPSKINQSGLNSNYQTQFNEGKNQIGQSVAQQRGQLAQSFANSGMGASSTPSGFQADQMRQLGSGQADAQGQLYAGLKGSQYNDALNNFWNASNIASGNAATAGGTATQAAGNSGSSSATIYGTAGQYHPSATAGVLGSALQAGGAVGAGAATHCPCAGSLILMLNGSEKPVDLLRNGDELRGVNGEACVVQRITEHIESAVCVETVGGYKSSSSSSHAFVNNERGGFVIAFEAFGRFIATQSGVKKVVGVRFLGTKRVFDIRTNGDHSYCADGIWAWGVGDVPSDEYLALKETAARLVEVAG